MKKILFLVLGIALILLLGKSVVSAQEEDKLRELNQKIAEYEQQVKNLQSQANTLSNQIAQFDAQINLTQLKIDQTQQQIVLLGGRIGELEGSLESLSEAFQTRAVETYKMARVGSSVVTLIASQNLSQAVSRYNYLRRIQESDRDLMIRLQSAQNVYKNQKEELEKLQEQLKSQRLQLDSQKKAKANLLAITKNDEKKYQELLANARAELAAISAIIAGRGKETEIRKVSDGERIASILTSGPNLRACSTGAHLHFEVVKDGVPQNPFGLLSSKSLIWDNIDAPQNGLGSWRWPLNDPIRITQGFGKTSYSSIYAGGQHTGVDMTNESNREIIAVKPGILYRGGIGCRDGTLQYVRVKQDDGYNSYYLHVNY